MPYYYIRLLIFVIRSKPVKVLLKPNRGNSSCSSSSRGKRKYDFCFFSSSSSSGNGSTYRSSKTTPFTATVV